MPPEEEHCFKIPEQLDLEFIGVSSLVEPVEFKAHYTKGKLAHLDAIPAEILVGSEFIDVFENFSEFPSERIRESLLTSFLELCLSIRRIG